MAKPALMDVSRWSPAAWAWGSFAALDVFVFLLWIGISFLLTLLVAVLAFGAVIWIYHGEMPRLPARGAPADTPPAPAPAPAPKAEVAPVAAPASAAAPIVAEAAPAPVPELTPTPAPAPKAEAAPAAPEPDAVPAVAEATAAPGPATPLSAGDLPEVDMEAAQAAASARVRSAAQEAGALARLAAAPVEVTRPVGLDAPRAGTGDDLKKIKGVGPKLEALLQRLGFWHFDQIAAWTPAELAWVDANLDAFNGRATREDWVGQAKLLASGGETEHSRAVERGEFDT